jgi:hypothetical protein
MLDQTIEDVVDKLVFGLSPSLLTIGFSLKKKRVFLRKLEECNQELNIQFRRINSQEAGYVEVCPNVIFEKIEKVTSFLRGEKYKRGWPTVAGNIGNFQLKREFIEWPITLTSDLAGLQEIISKSINTIAKPFWHDYSSIRQLIEGYENCDPRLTFNGPSYIWRLAAAYCIVNEPEKAINTLAKWSTGRPKEELIEQGIKKINELDLDSLLGGKI